MPVRAWPPATRRNRREREMGDGRAGGRAALRPQMSTRMLPQGAVRSRAQGGDGGTMAGPGMPCRTRDRVIRQPARARGVAHV